MKNLTLVLLRILVMTVAILMILSFILPWWTCSFSQTTGIWIYGWGLRQVMAQLSAYVAQDITPLYQTILAWFYLGLSIAVLISSTFIKRKIAFLLQGIVGLGYIAYALIAVYKVISNRVQQFSIPLQGRTSVGSGFNLQSSIQSGFYLALTAGGFIVLLAIGGFVIYRKRNNPSY
jgi:hypothetical protein